MDELWLIFPSLLCCVGIFFLTQHTYRRSDAMEESFLCALLWLLASCFQPDMLVMMPVIWWGYRLVWSNSFRMYMAFLIGVLLVAVYGACAYWLRPSGVVADVLDSWLTIWERRTLLDESVPYIVGTIVLALVGIFIVVAHLGKISYVAGRMQANILYCIPFIGLGILSCCFPSAYDYLPLWQPAILATLYLYGLYVHLHGFPRLLPRRRRVRRSRKQNRQALRYSN